MMLCRDLRAERASGGGNSKGEGPEVGTHLRNSKEACVAEGSKRGGEC